MNAKRIELQELKIKFNKLYEDNKNNKNLLAKILGIDLEKEFTRDELIDKLEHCKPSEEEKKKLREAHEIIKLKLEIESKKKKIAEHGTELEMSIKNAKSKVISKLSLESKKSEENFEKI